MSNSDYASQKLTAVMRRIKHASERSGRACDAVKLIGASKKQSIELITRFVEQGLTDLGENYLQEAIDKQCQSPSLEVDWHFIGQIQSNKTKAIAKHFNWVHGVDRLKIAKRLSQHVAEFNANLGDEHEYKPPINLLVQLNPDNERTKGGIALGDAPELCRRISELENVALRGFMMIPQARENEDEQRKVFASAAKLLEQINQAQGIHLDHLSMGMSGDLEAAIAEGSTMVRIGSDLFGARS